MRTDRHVVLVGLMGSGKTTVGRQLAARLGRPFVDNDQQVHTATGLTVAEISARQGVAEMRRLEAAALAEALAAPVPAVVTAAAGTILDENVRRRLRTEYVVWLRADPHTLAARVAGDPLRPLLGDDPEAVLRSMEEQRRPLFAEVADLSLAVDRLAPGDAASTIATHLADRPGGHDR